MSGTFCAKHPKGEFLAKGTGHLFAARSLRMRSGKYLADRGCLEKGETTHKRSVKAKRSNC